MRIILALVGGILIGGIAVWFYGTKQGKTAIHATGEQIQSTAKSTRDAIQSELKVLDLRSEDIKEDLARTGQVVRRKAREAGHALADGTADARVTAAIKAKFIADRDLSAMSISV